MWDFGKFGTRAAVIDEYGTDVTYAQLEQEGNKIADAIAK